MTQSAQISVRLLTSDDVDDFRTIRLMALQTDPDAFGSTFEDEATRPIERFAGRLTASSIFGAYRDDGIAAMAAFARRPGPKEKHKGFVWGMFVAPQARGNGAASALLDAVLDHAKDQVEQVTLTVITTNEPAIALYKRYGFETFGDEKRALKTSNGYLDETHMVRFF